MAVQSPVPKKQPSRIVNSGRPSKSMAKPQPIPASTPKNQMAVAPSQPAAMPQDSGMAPEGEKKSRKWLWITLAVVGVLIVAAAGAYYFLFR